MLYFRDDEARSIIRDAYGRVQSTTAAGPEAGVNSAATKGGKKEEERDDPTKIDPCRRGPGDRPCGGAAFGPAECPGAGAKAPLRAARWALQHRGRGR